MPELPEVETIKRSLEAPLIGKKFLEVKIYQKKLRWQVPANLNEKLRGQTIISLNRRGKYLLIELKTGFVIVHLGMSGRLYLADSNSIATRHDHVDFILNSENILRFTDPRKFGSILWSSDWTTHQLLCHLGVEPLSTAFDLAYLQQICNKRQAAIKQVLMNSKLLVGVGNIYAQEALFRAGIHPLENANRISSHHLQKLVTAIKAVLIEAIQQGGTSLKDFVDGDAKPGYFQQKLMVYGRGGESCFSCNKTLKLIRQQQRSTVFCPTCQPMKKQIALASNTRATKINSASSKRK